MNSPSLPRRPRTVLVDRLDWESDDVKRSLLSRWRATGWCVSAILVKPTYEITLTPADAAESEATPQEGR